MTAEPAKRLKPWLLAAFALTVMADPVSSVAYALQSALVHLRGDLASLLPTMLLVLGIIALVGLVYHQLIRRFPRGGGGAEALAAAFGDGWAFLPVGALLVDFTLTIAVSTAAASSALVAWAPGLEGERTILAVGLTGLVAGVSALGGRGRIAFACATLAFVSIALAVLVRGMLLEPCAAAPPGVAEVSWWPALLAVPLAMALATGVESPSNAIAQLDELDDDGRRRFGQWTIWAMLAVVGTLTIGFSVLSSRQAVAIPVEDSTLLADLARTATGDDPMFAAFQAASALLLLSAASSAFLAGSGLLKALALHGDDTGLLPRRFASANRFGYPVWGGVALLALAGALLLAAGAREQSLVPFYAVAVFASFLAALVAATVLAWRERRPGALVVAVAGTSAVAFVLALNLGRASALIALGSSAAVTLALWVTWSARGRPGDVARLAADGEPCGPRA